MSKMTLNTDGDRDIVVTRHFAAPPEAKRSTAPTPSRVCFRSGFYARTAGRYPFVLARRNRAGRSATSGQTAKEAGSTLPPSIWI
jgi:hypothetical protein